MNSARLLLRSLLLACCAGALSAAPAAPAGNLRSPQDAAPGESRPFFARVRGLFDIDLPQLDPPGTVKLTFRPHLADLYKRDYLRVATGLRWTVTEELELNLEGEFFGTHGLGDSGDGYGLGEARFGARYVLRSWPRAGHEAGLGLDVQVPTGQPPFDLTDGHNHITPSLVIQQHWPERPKLTTFVSAAWDIVTPSSVAGDFGLNTPRDDSVTFSAGAVYDLGQLKWTLVATYANTWVSGDDDHFFTLRPSVLWYVPKRFTFKGDTQWILGLGLRSTWGPDGHQFSANARVRAEVTFRQVMDSLRPAASR